MTTVHTIGPKHEKPVHRHLARLFLAGSLAVAAHASACAPSMQFINEGPGQPSDRASGTVPGGSIGVCKEPFSIRPPLVSEEYWEHTPPCRPKTPRRFIRVGYGNEADGPDTVARERLELLMGVLKQSATEPDANAKMMMMLRNVRQQGRNDVRLQARIERSSGRTQSCDYHYLLTTTAKHVAKQGEAGKCAARAYDVKVRDERCLFDTKLPEAVWLTSSWGCVAFTGTVGEGQSCYRMCEFDDFCAAQVSCAAADLDLLLCALGVCLPEKVAGVY